MALSRTGPPREGFEYQDLHGAIVALDWLAHPTSYAWVKFEAREYGSLDDFVVCDTNGNIKLYQVKHTGENPARPEFGFADLTDVSRPGTRSLFEKWYGSWAKVIRRGVFKSIAPVLKTNKPPSPELFAFTTATRGVRVFDVSSLKRTGRVFYDKFFQLTGNSKSAPLDTFLSSLQLEFDLPDIPVVRQLAEGRCRALSLNPTACRDLEDEVWKWAKLGSELSLADIKRACGWFEARGKEQRFPIPTDYVRLGGSFVDQIVNGITSNPSGGIWVIVGAPGSGNSTLLEDLYRELIQKSNPTVRHHYFLPGDEGYDRLKFQDAAEALIDELECNFPREMPTINPVPEKLDEVLSGIATTLVADNKSLVVALDGLDHVIRDEDESELINLLRKLLHKQRGLWLILGTRDFPASSRVAALIENYAPRDQWLSMPRFTRRECGRLLDFHRPALRLDNDQYFEEVVDAFFSTTTGYPLHARYVLSRLLQLASTKVLRTSDIAQIEPFGGDVPTLYSQVWNALAAAAKSISVLLSIARFGMSAEEMSAALKSLGTTQVLQGMESVRPFLEESSDGLRFFHSSFGEFVRSTADYESVAKCAAQDLITWLEVDAPDSKRWTWLLRKKAEFGDCEPLVSSTNRCWTIQSIVEGRSVDEVVSTLQLASASAMQLDDYGRAFSRAKHATTIENSLQFFAREWDSFQALNSRRLIGSTLGTDVSQDVENRGPSFLVELARDADNVGDRDLVSSIVDELNDRLLSSRKRTGVQDDVANLLSSLVRVAALLRSAVGRAIRFINRVESKYADTLAGAFADELVRSGQHIAFLEFVNSRQLALHIGVAGAEAGAIRTLHDRALLGSPSRRRGPWMRAYSALSGNSVSALPLPKHSRIPSKLADYDMDGQVDLTAFYTDVFVRAFLCGLLGRSPRVSWWKRQSPATWAGEAASAIAAFGDLSGAAARNKTAPDTVILDSLLILRHLEFPQDRDIWGYRVSLRKALLAILPTALTILHDYAGLTVGIEWCKRLAECNPLTVDDISELLQHIPTRAFHPVEAGVWIRMQMERWQTHVEEFPSRAEAYLVLATVSLATGDGQLTTALITKTVENMLGYGNHKDMFLLEVIEGIDACGKVVTKEKLHDWCKRVAPIANSIANYTDRDETSHFSVDFGEAVAHYQMANALREYVGLVSEERLYLAEDLFSKLLPFLNLKDPFEYGIARTSTDEESRRRLEALPDSAERRALAEELRSKYGTLPQQVSAYHMPGEEETQPDVDKVDPEKLKDVMAELRYSATRARFLEAWLTVWMDRAPQAAFSALEPWLHTPDPYMGDAAVLVLAFPYVKQFEGPGAAFSSLCKAHRAAYGWSRFFVDPGMREAIFGHIQTDYPDRWRDFIHSTLKGRRESYGVLTVPIGIEYLIRFKRNNEAASLCEAAVATLEELLEGVSLPQVDWLDSPASALDVLFARLFWISPVLREQAATVISELLVSPVTSAATLEYLTIKLKAENLDSKVVVLLMPLIRAAGLGYKPDLAALRSAVQVSSFAVKTILAEIDARVSK